ncbi:MAG: KH domain-containing protein [Vicinamibacteria bacterium]|nr:KH domain-containing protein [Vicinamibacteria bacterium]
MRELAKLVEAWLRLLVRAPERVRVSVAAGDPGRPIRLMIFVAAEDRGQVVGKGGRTIGALKTVVDAVARRRGLRCQLDVIE